MYLNIKEIICVYINKGINIYCSNIGNIYNHKIMFNKLSKKKDSNSNGMQQILFNRLLKRSAH